MLPGSLSFSSYPSTASAPTTSPFSERPALALPIPVGNTLSDALAHLQHQKNQTKQAGDTLSPSVLATSWSLGPPNLPHPRGQAGKPDPCVLSLPGVYTAICRNHGAQLRAKQAAQPGCAE
jgi:hypothetical protein